MKNKKPVKTALLKLISHKGGKLQVAVDLRLSLRYIDMMLKGKIPSQKVYDDIQALLNN